MIRENFPTKEGHSGRFIWHPIRITPSRFGETGLALFIHNEKDAEHKETWNLFVKND
jgi:hypothetical protein